MQVVWRNLAVGLLLLAASVVQAAEPAPSIVPDEGSANPVQVGQAVSLAPQGVTDPTAAHVLIWPKLDWSLIWKPVITKPSEAVGDEWKSWGPAPEVQIVPRIALTPLQPGKSLVVMSVGQGTPVTYEIEAQGEIPPPVFVVTPEGPFQSRGRKGGPFEPRLQRYSVESNAEWTIAADVEWLIVAPQGVDDASGVTDVIISPAAEKLAEGTHQGLVTFTSGDLTQTRAVELVVSSEPPPPPPPPPVERLSVVLIYESDDVDDQYPWLANVLTSQKIRRLENDKVWMFFADRDEKDQNGKPHPNTKTWIDFAAKEKLPLPQLFLVNEKGDLIHNEAVPQTVDAVVSLIQEYAP